MIEHTETSNNLMHSYPYTHTKHTSLVPLSFFPQTDDGKHPRYTHIYKANIALIPFAGKSKIG